MNSLTFSSREEEIRATLSESEVIRKIEEEYPAHYSLTSGLDAWDQLLACESVAESTPVKDNVNETDIPSDNVGVNGNGNGSCKRSVNFELNEGKLQVILKLKTLNYKTPPFETAQLLEEFFFGCGTKHGWWLRVAQQWNPKSINSSLNIMVKRIKFGQITLNNPAKYFTSIIQYHPKRKVFRRINGTRKQE